MRRFVAMLLTVFFAGLCVSYANEMPDFSKYTYEELLSLKCVIDEEIAQRSELTSENIESERADSLDAQKKNDNWWDYSAVRKTIDGGDSHTIAILEDGSLIAVGGNSYNQCDVTQWTDIVAISAGERYHTVGLRANGTVIATGWNWHHECDVESWTDIVAIDTMFHTVGLKSDGTVVATGWNLRNECNVGAWTDIVSVVAGAIILLV